MRLGEADRIVTVLLQEAGKVRAVAKGVRRTRSKLGGRVEPLTEVRGLFWRGRELDVVSQIEAVEVHRRLREDLGRLSQALAMAEAVDGLLPDRQPVPELLAMLHGALRRLEVDPWELVAPAFFLKLLALEGSAPIVEACASCGATEPLVAFDLARGGVLCVRCRQGQAVSPEALGLLRAVLGGRLAAALDAAPTGATWEVAALARASVEHVLERRLRTPLEL
jgi:DNA repair protein RecO (recombination protein O)